MEVGPTLMNFASTVFEDGMEKEEGIGEAKLVFCEKYVGKLFVSVWKTSIDRKTPKINSFSVTIKKFVYKFYKI